MSEITIVDRLMIGMEILKKYGVCDVATGHEVIYFGPKDISKLTDDDKQKLEDMNWHFDEETESWAKFV